MSFISWYRSRWSGRRHPAPVANPFRGRLAFERLEDRRLLAAALNPAGPPWMAADGIEPSATAIVFNQPVDSNPSLAPSDTSIVPSAPAVPWNDPSAQDWADWLSHLSLAPTTAAQGSSWLLVSESGAWTQFAVSADPTSLAQQLIPVATGMSSPDASPTDASIASAGAPTVAIGAWIAIEPPVDPSAMGVSSGSINNPFGPMDAGVTLIGAGQIQDGSIAWIWTHTSPGQNGGDNSPGDGSAGGNQSGGNSQPNSWNVSGIAASPTSEDTAATVSQFTVDTVFQLGPHGGNGNDGHHHSDSGGTNDSANGDATDDSNSGAPAEHHAGRHHDGNHHHDDQNSQGNNGDPSQSGDSTGDLGNDNGDSTDAGTASSDGSSDPNSDDGLSIVGTGTVGAKPHHHGGHHAHRVPADASVVGDVLDTSDQTDFTAAPSSGDNATDLNFTTEIDDVTPPPTSLPQPSPKLLDHGNADRWSFLAVAMGDRFSDAAMIPPVAAAASNTRGDVGNEILESGHFVFVGANSPDADIRGARRVLAKAAANPIATIGASYHPPLATSTPIAVIPLPMVPPSRETDSVLDSTPIRRGRTRFVESSSADALTHAPLYVHALKTVDEQPGSSNRLDQIGWWGIVSQFVLAPQFPRNHQPTIMLAVADEASRDAMNVALVKANFLVLTAATARDAINLLRTPLSPIDVALLDVHLPDVNGVDLCARLRELYPTLPVLVCADQAPGHEDVAQLNRMDVQRIFAKPVAINDLLAAVKSIVS